MNSIFRLGKLQRCQNNFRKYYSTSNNIFIPIEYKDTANNEMDTKLLKKIVTRVIEERDQKAQLPNLQFSFTPISGGITNKLFKCKAFKHLHRLWEICPGQNYDSHYISATSTF